MIALIEALNFRCLRYVRQSLDPFHVLIGPNASGKSTFLDVIAFLGKLVSDGVEQACLERTDNFVDLVWKREGDRFELAIEATIPDEFVSTHQGKTLDRVRYEVAVGLTAETKEIGILAEKVVLMPSETKVPESPSLFPMEVKRPAAVIQPAKKGTKTIISKSPDGNDHYTPETKSKPSRWAHTFKLGAQNSALRNLPSDDDQFPVSNWLKSLLANGVQPFVLNSLAIRKASPPNQRRGFKTDGSNLPWVVQQLKQNPDRFHSWLDHLRTALPDIVGIDVVLRPEDRHRYLVIQYQGGYSVPSWMISDGTLRLLSLTLPAYMPDFRGIYLIEEPENGIHPKAVECVFQSLSSVYDAQILLASHSPVILGIADAKSVLCFAKTEDGATDIVRGDLHPRLQDWKGETNLGVLFAAGVLG